MPTQSHHADRLPQLPPSATSHLKAWHAVQFIVWIANLGLLVALFAWPKLGLHLLWHVLIPLAPALFVFVPGVWRNICPLGYSSLLPWRLGLSRRIRLSQTAQGIVFLCGVVLLLTVAPLRHVVLNTSGLGSAVAVLSVGVLALLAGYLFERKSGWCAGMCPVYPVESLYGQRPALTPLNAHCAECFKCAQPCPESRSGTDPTRAGSTAIHRWVGTIMTGGFVGFVWGWFQVPDADVGSRLQGAGEAYLMCFGGLAATLAVYMVLRRVLSAQRGLGLNRVFAAAAVSCYYWYALPTMIGLGADPAAGILNFSDFLPEGSIWVARVAPVVVFMVWLGVPRALNRAWMTPPPVNEKPEGLNPGMPSSIQSLSISASRQD